MPPLVAAESAVGLEAAPDTVCVGCSGCSHPSTCVLDPLALARLACELESEDLARSIANTYLRMLDSRLSRTETALESRDEVAAMDVLLSLRVSSCTVGLMRLESAVLCVIDAVRRGEAELARVRGARLAALAAAARSALRAHLDLAWSVQPG